MWGDVTTWPDFKEKLHNLVSGLDRKSAETVTCILTRINRINATKKRCIDFFTQEEQQELRAFRESVASAVVQVSDDLFAWEGYLLPENDFGNVLDHRRTLSTLKTLDSVKGKAIIDAGGYIGDTALAFSELSPSAIYIFEPVPENFAKIKRTIELNRITNAVPENMALGAENNTLTLHVEGGSSTFNEINFIKCNKDIDVPVRALDDYVSERKIKIGLIKTDIEGAELDFLAGAKKTICEQKPILLISIYHSARDFFEIKPLIESWNLGYRFRIYHPTIGSVSNETLLIAELD